MADGRQRPGRHDWEGLDGPRPLPAGLRRRLEDSLLTDSPRTLRPTLANRLSYALADDPDPSARDVPPDAGPDDDTSRLLSGLDARRPLPGPLSDRLTGSLLGLPGAAGPLPSGPAGGRAAMRFRAAAGLAAACLVVAGGVVALDHSPASRPAASRSGPAPSLFQGASRSPASPLGGASGAGTGGSVASVSAQPAAGLGTESTPPGGGPAAPAPGSSGSASAGPGQPGAAAGSPSAASGPVTGSQGGAGSASGTSPAGAPSASGAQAGGSASAGAGGSGPSAGGAAPSPVLSSLTPDRGPAAGGTWVTIAGSGLGGASAVRFGSVPAYHFQVLSPSQIRAEAPPHAPGKVEVIVVTPAGSTRPGQGSVYLFTPG